MRLALANEKIIGKGENMERKILMEKSIEALERRGVRLEDIGEIIIEIQKRYSPELTMELAIKNVKEILSKREVAYSVLLGIELDELAEKKLLSEPLQTIIETDNPLFGIDEILPLSIVNIHGTIGLTNFGYLDKVKLGIIEELDNGKINKVNTFLDDIVAGIAASVASRIAHSR